MRNSCASSIIPAGARTACQKATVSANTLVQVRCLVTLHVCGPCRGSWIHGNALGRAVRVVMWLVLLKLLRMRHPETQCAGQSTKNNNFPCCHCHTSAPSQSCYSSRINPSKKKGRIHRVPIISIQKYMSRKRPLFVKC